MYYRFIFNTITTITTVSAVAIPPNPAQHHQHQDLSQHQAPNQVYGQRPGIHGKPQNEPYSTVPIVIPTPGANGIPEPRYERKEDQFKKIHPPQYFDHAHDYHQDRYHAHDGHDDHDDHYAGQYLVGKPSSTSLQPSQSGYLPRGPSGIPMGPGPVIIPGTSHTPVKRDVEAWPTLNGVPLGHGPVVIQTTSTSTSNPTPTGASNQDTLAKRAEGKRIGSFSIDSSPKTSQQKENEKGQGNYIRLSTGGGSKVTEHRSKRETVDDTEVEARHEPLEQRDFGEAIREITKTAVKHSQSNKNGNSKRENVDDTEVEARHEPLEQRNDPEHIKSVVQTAIEDMRKSTA